MDMVDYLHGQGIQVERCGSYYRALCPFHNERHPSFYIKDNRATCFGGCPEKQSHFDFVELIYRLEFPRDENRRRAFEKARELGAIPSDGITRYRIPTQLPEPTEEQVEAMTAMCEVYRDFLHARVGFVARQWLTETRGLSGPLYNHVLDGLGFAPNGAQFHSKAIDALKGITRHWVPLAISVGLLTAKGSQRLRSRIIFPVRDAKGKVIFYQGRTILDGEEFPTVLKHLNVNGIKKVPYIPIPRELATHPGTYIVEGPMDAIAYAANTFYSWGLLGSRVPTAATLRNLSHPIIGCLDNDLGVDQFGNPKAGPQAQLQLHDRCIENALPFIDGTSPHDIKDPSKWLQEWGPEQFTAAHELNYAIAA